jgi:hypothetical protein
MSKARRSSIRPSCPRIGVIRFACSVISSATPPSSVPGATLMSSVPATFSTITRAITFWLGTGLLESAQRASLKLWRRVPARKNQATQCRASVVTTPTILRLRTSVPHTSGENVLPAMAPQSAPGTTLRNPTVQLAICLLSLSTDIAHTEVTDHHIPVRSGSSPSTLQDENAPGSSLSLVPFPDSKEARDDIRDLGLAWQSLADSGIPQAASQADRLLSLAVKQSPDDPAILSGLAYIELNRGAVDHARKIYQKAPALDPTSIDAATNLGVIEAKSGHLRTAVALWPGAFDRAPGKSSIGMNLARAFCESGQWTDARSHVVRVLHFNPDLSEARKLFQHLNGDPPSWAPELFVSEQPNYRARTVKCNTGIKGHLSVCTISLNTCPRCS